MPMLLFVMAHALQLRDGTYVVRSPDVPGCETQNFRIETARQAFGEALSARLVQMIGAGEAPTLYTYEELENSYAVRCARQIEAPDRMPGCLDKVMAIRAKLPPEAAERLSAMRMATQNEIHAAAGQMLRDRADSAAEPERAPARLDPSARLAMTARQLPGRDRRA
jgi:hypothetical protein